MPGKPIVKGKYFQVNSVWSFFIGAPTSLSPFLPRPWKPISLSTEATDQVEMAPFLFLGDIISARMSSQLSNSILSTLLSLTHTSIGFPFGQCLYLWVWLLERNLIWLQSKSFSSDKSGTSQGHLIFCRQPQPSFLKAFSSLSSFSISAAFPFIRLFAYNSESLFSPPLSKVAENRGRTLIFKMFLKCFLFGEYVPLRQKWKQLVFAPILNLR